MPTVSRSFAPSLATRISRLTCQKRCLLLLLPREQSRSRLPLASKPRPTKKTRKGDALQSFVEQHVDGQLFAPQHLPGEPARLLWLARFVTLWTIALEGLVAVTFLWPLGRGLSALRDMCLIIFCATTYAVAPVEGFGWLLIAVGVAQCEPERGKTRLVYLAVFGLILFYREVPWAEQLLELVRTSEVAPPYSRSGSF